MAVVGGTAFHVTSTGIVASAAGGILHVVTVNTGAADATIKLYDGTKDDDPEIAAIAATDPGTFTYDAVLNAGLYAVVSGVIDVTIVIQPAHQFAA